MDGVRQQQPTSGGQTGGRLEQQQRAQTTTNEGANTTASEVREVCVCVFACIKVHY